MKSNFLVAFGGLLLLTRLTWGAPGSPDLKSVQPSGAQRGTPLHLTFTGDRLQEAQEVMLYGAGIAIGEVTSKDEHTVIAEGLIAPDCPLGEHLLRLRTASGISDMKTFYIGALPVVEEVEPNGDLASAQKIQMNSTIAGVVKREDADYYAVEVRAGESLTAEIEAMRLGRTLFDPAIVIMDSKRFELAVNDDSKLLGQDSSASIVVPADGVYYVQVREAAYGGSDACQYRLHIGSFPRPHAAWPPGGKPGQSLDVSFIGGPKPTPPLAMVLAPEGERIRPVWAVNGPNVAPSPNWICVADLPLIEPSVDTRAPDGDPKTDYASPPMAFHGVLQQPGEPGRHKFKAKGKEPLDIRVLARRLRTPLDAVLDVFDEKGGRLAGNDDAVGADPELRFTPPADGVYELRVRDFRNRAGEDFVYRVEIEPPRPSLAVQVERVDPRRPQFLQAVCVPKGSRFAIMVRADRKDLAGEATFEVPVLPEGVTVKVQSAPADLPTAPMIFEAVPDAPLGGRLCELRPRVAETTGTFRQAIPLVLGPPNDTVYYQTVVDRIPIAVTQAAPFRVRIEQPATPVLRQGGKSLKIIVDRDEGFAADVGVQMLWNPPGISSVPSVNVAAAQSEAAYAVNAAGDAPLKSWKVCVLAHAAVQGGDVWISSDFVDLTIADTFESGTLQMAATERGKPAAMACKLKPVRAFEGKARVKLLGLPPKTHCAIKEVSADETEIQFEIETEAEAPVGQHRGLFCEFEVAQGGETVSHRLASDGVLRIDAPPQAPANQAASTPPAAPPAGGPPPKPLSRLEQLRKNAGEQGKKPEETPK